MDPYKILGVDRDASLDQIKRAYIKVAKRHHPDRGGDTWAFQQVQEAYDMLVKMKSGAERSKTKATPQKNKSKESTPASGNEFDFANKSKAAVQPKSKRKSMAYHIIGTIGGAVGAVIVFFIVVTAFVPVEPEELAESTTQTPSIPEAVQKSEEKKPTSKPVSKTNSKGGEKQKQKALSSLPKNQQPAVDPKSDAHQGEKSLPRSNDVIPNGTESRDSQSQGWWSGVTQSISFVDDIVHLIITQLESFEAEQLPEVNSDTAKDTDESIRLWVLLNEFLIEYEQIEREPITQLRNEKLADFATRFDKQFVNERFVLNVKITDYVEIARGEYSIKLSQRTPEQGFAASYTGKRYFRLRGDDDSPSDQIYIDMLDSVNLKLSKKKAKEIKPGNSQIRIAGQLAVWKSRYKSQPRALKIFELQFMDLNLTFVLRNYKLKLIQPISPDDDQKTGN